MKPNPEQAFIGQLKKLIRRRSVASRLRLVTPPSLATTNSSAISGVLSYSYLPVPATTPLQTLPAEFIATPTHYVIQIVNWGVAATGVQKLNTWKLWKIAIGSEPNTITTPELVKANIQLDSIAGFITIGSASVPLYSYLQPTTDSLFSAVYYIYYPEESQ
jgi:hypothetical protein